MRECLTIRETSERLPVVVASVTRWLKQPEPKAFREGRLRKTDLDLLAQDIAAEPDLYQYERAARFGVCQKSLWVALGKLAPTHKKRLCHPKADEAARQEFLSRIAKYETAGKAVDMPRTHGYAPRGQRCFGTHNWQTKRRINALGTLLHGVLLTVSFSLAKCPVAADHLIHLHRSNDHSNTVNVNKP